MGTPFITISLALAVVLGACQPEDPQRASKKAQPPAKGSYTEDGSALRSTDQPLDVQITKPLRKDVAYVITLPANIAPLYQTTLYAKVSGYLKWIGPDKGDQVKKGQVVAVIDAPEVEEQYQQAAADYKIKRITFDRLKSVWKESPDVIAKQDVDVAEAAYEGARTLMQQRAVLRDYTKVRAPYDGTITARFADPGALIQVATSSATSAIPLFTIMDLNTVRIYANVPQDDSPWIVPGQTQVTVHVHELQDRSFTGAITRSTLALDPSTRSLLVEVDLPNGDHALRPGTFAEIAIALREIPNALVLPPQAINSTNKGTTVFVVEQGIAKVMPIRTGITDGQWLEITEGLRGDEDVVVVGKRQLLDQSPVRTSPFQMPEAKPSQQKFERRSPGAHPSAVPKSDAPLKP
jgi:RND family efflux transporter MFP subunit